MAGLLAMPTVDSLTLLEELAGQEAWLGDAVAELKTLALEHWQGEHTRLFVSGYPHTACPPFESAYRSGQMGGPMVEDVVALYRRYGLEATDIPADYLGALLECAAHLLERPQPVEQSAWLTLWEGHLATWVPRFANDLIKESRIVLYRRLGQELYRLFSDDDRSPA